MSQPLPPSDEVRTARLITLQADDVLPLSLEARYDLFRKELDLNGLEDREVVHYVNALLFQHWRREAGLSVRELAKRAKVTPAQLDDLLDVVDKQRERERRIEAALVKASGK